MSIVPKVYTMVDGQIAEAAQVNKNFDDIYNNVNGNLDNTNLVASAAIADSKLATITTGGKVNGAALTGLASIPSGAGVIPTANIPTSQAVKSDGSVSPVNLVDNGSFENHSAGTSAVPDSWVLENTPTLATDTGDTGYGSISQKITAVGAALEGIKYTLTGLKASTKYSVSWRTKVTTGDTSQVLTTGAGTNMSATESTSTTFETKTGTFTTDASGTNVVLKLMAKADGDIVWFDGIQVNQGESIFAYASKSVGYLEGTWTVGVAFGGGTTGITYNASTITGYYTKIGNMVTISAFLELTNKGSDTGGAYITGLPFISVDNNAAYAPVSFRIANTTFANQFQGFVPRASSQIALEEITEAGVVTTLTNGDFTNTTTLMVSGTYRCI